MSEQFVKLHKWMGGMGLTPNELMIFAVIHSFTEHGRGYDGGLAGLTEWTGCSLRTVNCAVRKLESEGWILNSKPSKGRVATVYHSNRAEIARLTVQKLHSNRAEIAPDKKDNKDIEILNNNDTHKELTDILTAASLNLPQFTDQEVEMREQIQEMWEAAEMNLFGERLSNREIRRLIRTLDRDKAFDLCARIKRAEVHGMIEDREYKKEYWYSTIYNKLRETRAPYKDSIEELRLE